MIILEDLDEVRKRMSSKRQKPMLTQKGFGKFYKFAISTMYTIAFLLFCGCFVKSNPNFDVKTYINQNILALLPNISFDQEKPVANSTQYQLIKDDMYKTSNEYIQALDYGVVMMSEKNSITIMYDNGIIASYSNLAKVNVKKLDRIAENELLGTYENYFNMILKKDDKTIKYEEIYA